MKIKFTRRALSVLLSAVILLTALPLSVFSVSAQDLTGAYGQVLLEGTVNWVDDGNADGFRPGSVEVGLYANNVEVMKQTVTGPDWKYSFDISDGVPGFDSPVGLTFTVSHPPVDRYNTSEIVHPVVQFSDPSVTGGWKKESPCSDLNISHEGVPGMSVVASKMTTDGIVVIWSEEPLAGYERSIIIDSLEKNANGIGNPKGYVFLSGEGANSEYGITVRSTHVLYEQTNKWSMFFVGIYSRGESTVSPSHITNTYAPELITVQAEKVWNDENDRDRIRPASVTFQLYKTVNGNTVTVGSPVTVDGSTRWACQFENLHKYEDGHLIEYSVQEVSVPEGYTSTVEYDPEGTGVIVVTNTHIPAKVSVSASKEWDDNDNRDNARPTSVTLALYADGVKVEGSEKTVSEDNDWSARWNDLYQNVSGKLIQYTVREENVPEGYTVSYTASSANNYVITNSRTEVATTDVPVRKVWNDNDNQDGVRPTGIVVQLYADGAPIDTLTLTDATLWQGVFRDLPKYRAGAVGVAIGYTVAEITAQYPANSVAITDGKIPAIDGRSTGYTGTVSGNAEDGYLLTNTHVPETVSVKAEKRWDDQDNQDGVRPASVTLHLLADGVHTGQTRTVVPDENGAWLAEWNDLPQYKHGWRIDYTVTEGDLAEGYSVSYSMEDGVRIVTNRYTPEKTAVNVEKIWDDQDNRDGIRPESVEVALYANGTETGKTVTLTREGRWIGSFTDLDRMENGTEIVYTVQEITVVPGYEAPTYSVDTYTGDLEIINKHVPETTEVRVSKVWDDQDDRDGKRPASVTVELYADGVSTGKTAVLSDANGWSITFPDLAKKSNGTDVVYGVAETAVPAGYKVTYTRTNDGLVITNRYLPEKLSIPVTKVWDDGNDQDGIRPESVTVGLYKGDVKIHELVLQASDLWQGEFADLDKYENGTEIVYTVKEETVPEGYTQSVDGFVITNTHIPQVTSLAVNKVWDDDDNCDGMRPEKIVVHIEKNGEHMGPDYKRELSEANGWKTVWEDLPKYTDGEENVYLAYEETVAGYDAHYVRNSETSVTVTNVHVPERIAVSVVKVWEDGNNRDGIRPGSVTVQLYANGTEVPGESLTLSEANQWQGIFHDLVKYQNGEAIRYTVEEVTTADGYTQQVVTGTDGIHRVTNTHAPETTVFRVSKEWADGNDSRGVRPDAIVVQLYANDVAVPDGIAELSDANGWQYTWDSIFEGPMYVYRNGERIVYTVQEIGYMENGVQIDGIPLGYTVSYDGSDDGYSTRIKNTYRPGVTPPPDVEVPGITPEPQTPPQTGDEAELALWFALLLLSGAGIFGLTFRDSKNRS